MGFSTTAKNDMLDAFADKYVWASLHSADPGDTGASEIAGGSPAYARKGPLTWDPATGALVEVDTGTPPVFDVPSGVTVNHGGLWSASTGGDWGGGDAVTSVAFSGQGQYELTAITGTLT